MLLGLTPGLKCSSIQAGSMILEEAIDRLESASWFIETPT
jgi:hypothetical protein